MPTALRVIFVEDSPDDALLVSRQLRRSGYEVESVRVDRADALIKALAAHEWDLVIADYSMPAFTGSAALRIVRERHADLPFIFVSGTIGEDTAVAAMRTGAQDYIMKGNLARLAPAVERELNEARLRRDHREVQQQLFQHQRLEAVDRLASGIAHDFNNLLAIVLSGCATVHDDLPASSPHRETLSDVMNAAGRGAALTQQLLAFSRRKLAEPQVFDLCEMVSGFLPMLRRVVPENVELRTVFTVSPAWVRADAGRLEQVLLNLVVNACDAMPNGGSIDIETSKPNAYVDGSVNPPPPMVGLLVRDSGIGMTPELQARVFEPFFTTKPVGQGGGLGLASAHAIVRQAGGTIEVTSSLGQGSTFTIHLPEAPPAAPSSAAAPGVAPRGSEQILLVEDDPLLLRLLESQLRAFGYSVLAAGSLEEAAECSRNSSGSIALVVTDVVMPGAGGPDVARSMRELHPGIRVLYTSGYADNVLKPEDLSPRGVAFIRKPFSAAEFGRTVRALLDSSFENE